MRILVLKIVLAGALAPSLSCGEAKSERCQQVCQQETDCAEERSSDGENYPYDLDECVNACVGLERDSNNRKKVMAHVECAKKAGDNCEELMKCRF